MTATRPLKKYKTTTTATIIIIIIPTTDTHKNL
jgi:hypothetical protein